MLKLPLLVLDVADHLAHEMRLIDLRKALADTVGALVEPKRYRHCHGTDYAAGAAGFAQVLEQHVAPQGVADGIQRRQWSLGAQVPNGFGEVFAGTGVIAARQQIRLTRTATPVERHTGPALSAQHFLQAGDIRRIGRTGQAVQHQNQWRIGAVRAMPVKVEEVTVCKPQAFTFAVQVGGFAPERSPQGLQVRVAEAEGWRKAGA